MWKKIILVLSIAVCSAGLTYSDMYIQDEVVGVDENGSVERLKIERSYVVLSKEEIFHHDILEVRIMSESDLDPEMLRMRVYKDEIVCPLLDLITDIPFLSEKNNHNINVYRAVYLPNWNEMEGRYQIKIFYGKKLIVTREGLGFNLMRRSPETIKKGLSVVDLELNSSIKSKSYRGPYGDRMNYRAVCEWARFMNADALWILSGETTTFRRRRVDDPWDPGPLENLYLLKELAEDYELDIGAYIMSFYVPGSSGVTIRYDAGIGYNSEKDYLYRSRHISLVCEKRIEDIIKLARSFQQDPEIDYIGFDFIRTGRADGYELASMVVQDTNIKTPREWTDMSEKDKMVWFAKKIEVERDPLITEKWRWWRAHKVAKIIERIIEEAGITKPVWVYTLGWDHGREHGQDPVMFFDAGVSIDAVMLYEANRHQFPRMLDQWKRYMNEEHGNIIVGNCVDERLLDSVLFGPPQEFYRRNVQGFSGIFNHGIASGIFFHDIGRAFWGKKGGYTTMDYAISHISSIYDMKKELGEVDLFVDVEILMEDEEGSMEGYILLKNNSTNSFQNIEIECLYPYDDTILYNNDYQNPIIIPELSRFESKRIDFSVTTNQNPIRKGYLRFWVEIDGKERYCISSFNKSQLYQ
ncbi:MAG: hypothetical protein JSV25_10635 [Spirochaetota bacterium]|nr:MAG: hypothetical protein JSV25_10635 [Spirochaetota bacterium]